MATADENLTQALARYGVTHESTGSFYDRALFAGGHPIGFADVRRGWALIDLCDGTAHGQLVEDAA